MKNTNKLMSKLSKLAVVSSLGLMAAASVNAESKHYPSIATKTKSVISALDAFVATLSSDQIGSVQSTCTMDASGTLYYEFTDGLTTCWTNLPGGRNGLQFSKLSDAQLEAALHLAKVALGARGNTMLSELRAADGELASVNSSMWGSELYSVAIYGTPSTTEPWMLQFAGHHLAYNLTYNGTYNTATPMFLGVEPTNWTDSSGVAHAPMDIQREAAENLANALQADSTAATAAKLSGSYDDVVMGATGNMSTSCDANFPLTYPTSNRGELVSSLTNEQKRLVKKMIAAWTKLMPAAWTKELNSVYESKAALAETYVGYSTGSGGTADFGASPSGTSSQGSYLRIDGPRIWIEFAIQPGIGYSNSVHYHTIWRDKVADYGGEFTTKSTRTTGQCGNLSSSSSTTPGGTPFN